MSKRRVFDIDFPADAPDTPEEARAPGREPPARRGPMAAAISENAEALRDRAEAEAAIRQENDRLAHEHMRLKRDGLITDLLPIDQIATSKLIRDRAADRDADLDELKSSIRAVGLSNPIRVELTKQGYELIQGYRRLAAYRALFEDTGEARFSRIPAGIYAEGEPLGVLYRRMVDENLVRRDVSFAEMARLALHAVADRRTSYDSLDQAIAELYASAGRQKRSYIRHFTTLVEALDGDLRFLEAMPRQLGLDLVKALDEDPDLVAALRERVQTDAPASAAAELESVRAVMDARRTERMRRDRSPAPKARAKTTLTCTVPAGTVRLAAREGRVELAMKRDFSSIDRQRLERAVAAFMAVLDDTASTG